MKVKGYGNYRITTLGKVINSLTGKNLTPRLRKKTGYLSVVLYNSEGKKSFSIHRLVATHFIPNPNNYPCVLHKDNDKTNNGVNNLKWGTHKMNSDQMISEGRDYKLRGIHHPLCRLSEEDIKFIRKYKLPAKELAELFGVSPNHISKIRRFKNHKKLK